MDNKYAVVLTDNEIETLYGRPLFGPREQEIFFTLNSQQQIECDHLQDAFTKSYFILLLGYFKVNKLRLDLTWGQVKEDLAYIYKRYFPQAPRYRKNLPVRIRNRLYRIIFNLFDCNYFSGSWREQLRKHLNSLATKMLDKRYLFDEALCYLERHTIEIPAYSTLLKLVSGASLQTERDVAKYIDSQLTKDDRNVIRSLLEKDKTRYGVTKLMKNIKDFSYGQTSEALEQKSTLEKLYPLAKKAIENCGLSLTNVQHLADLGHRFSSSQLKHFGFKKASVYIMCFSYFYYQKANDYLVKAYIKLIRKYRDKGSEFSVSRQNKEAEIVAKQMDNLAEVLNLFDDGVIDDMITVSDFKKVTFSIIPKSAMSTIAQYLAGVTIDKKSYLWEYYDSKTSTITHNLRRLFLAIDFGVSDSNPILGSQLERAKKILEATPRNFCLDKRLMKKSDQPYLFEKNGESDSGRHEWYFYQLILDQLEPDNVFVLESLNYKPLSSYLVNKDRLNHKAPGSSFTPPLKQLQASDFLDELKNKLDDRLTRVSQQLNEGAYDFVELGSNNKEFKWHRPYKTNSNDRAPIFSQCTHPESIVKILQWVEKNTGYSKLLGQEKLTQAGLEDMVACLIANGTNIGLPKMAKISDRAHKILQQTEANYLTLEALRELNSCIVNSTASLPFYVAYKNKFDHLRASIDGQKFELRFRNILARHSPKYFGMKPGISVMTLVAGHLPINSKVISANEHESHHIYDLLFNQMTDMKLDIISTDQHGINAFNFAIMNSYGYQFAPRYAKFKKHFENHFQLKSDSKLNCSIELRTKINWDLILEEWDSIIQILASLEQKNTTQEYLIKRLCGYKKYNKTIKALAEYDRVYRLMYLLDYVDDESLRRHVQGSLCNGEAFHQMQRTIASANGSDKIRGFDEKDLMVWNESAKLIANSVIYYNTAILSRLLEHYKATGYQEGLDRIMKVSPISWTHVNFSGHFMFANNDEYFGIEDIVEELKLAA